MKSEPSTTKMTIAMNAMTESDWMSIRLPPGHIVLFGRFFLRLLFPLFEHQLFGAFEVLVFT